MMTALLAGAGFVAVVAAIAVTVGVAAYRSHHRQPEPTMWLADR